MMTGSVRNQRESMEAGSVDLLVTMHLPGIGMLEFERTREVAEAGYLASKDTVAEWAATRSELGVA
jgi:predicted acylesterase/phospholipase RssA